jgi:hypothetical protein
MKDDDFCFVVGLEILDNMPHDRLYSASHQGVSADEQELTHISTVKLDYPLDSEGQVKEHISEQVVPLS